MSDPLQPIVRSEEQKSFLELRDEFRAENHARVQRMLFLHTLIMRDKDGVEVKRFSTGFKTTNPNEHRRVDDWIKSGGSVPEPSSDFQVIEGPGLDKELRDIVRDIRLMEQSDGVQRPESVVEIGELHDLSDESVLQYASQHIPRESLHPHLQRKEGLNEEAPGTIEAQRNCRSSYRFSDIERTVDEVTGNPTEGD